MVWNVPPAKLVERVEQNLADDIRLLKSNKKTLLMMYADSVRSNLLTFLSGFHMNRIDLKTTRGNIELSGSPATGHNKMGDQCDLPLIAGPSTTDQQPLGQRMVSPE